MSMALEEPVTPPSMGARGMGWLRRRMMTVGGRMTMPFGYYLYTPMVNPDGSPASESRFAYALHLILACFSEALIRTILSFVFVMAVAGVNGGVINFTAAALAKGLVLGICIMVMGKISAYSRFENVLASWFPSSIRMWDVAGNWGPKAVQPYADLIHVVSHAIFQYGGSLLGLALAMWVSNSFTINLGQPTTMVDTFGLFGTYAITTSDMWLVEIYGSAILTFAWLMLVVHRVGAKHHIYLGLAMGFVFAAVALVTMPATGANFDFIHYAALQTILANKGVVNLRHQGPFLAAPLIGAVVAWVGYIVVASLSFAGGYTKPGVYKTAIENVIYAGKRVPGSKKRGSIYRSNGNKYYHGN